MVMLYYFIAPKFRYIFLLMASYYFYASWNVHYLWLILFTTAVDYGIGIGLEKTENPLQRKLLLWTALVSNLGLLFFFKYYHFATDTIQSIGEPFNLFQQLPELKVLLPVGISFYTFQALSYVVEVYWGKEQAERHPGYFALYIVYFPQLVAGPIERYSRLAPQLKANHGFNYDNIRQGLQLVLFGLFVKMVVADNLAPFADSIFSNPADYHSASIFTGIFFYSFQIYADFYGYSTIAVGAALMMGVKIMDNFKTPYLSRSIGEFWKRWHISLSTWFRDYVFIPMGGSRVNRSRLFWNILVVFGVSGLWHGANWTFVVWGLIHALLYFIESRIVSTKGKSFEVNRWTISTMLQVIHNFIWVSLAWVFFRSSGFDQAMEVFQALGNFDEGKQFLLVPQFVWGILLVFIVSDWLLYRQRIDDWLSNQGILTRWFSYAFMLYGIMALSGVEHVPFIYFQF